MVSGIIGLVVLGVIIAGISNLFGHHHHDDHHHHDHHHHHH